LNENKHNGQDDKQRYRTGRRTDNGQTDGQQRKQTDYNHGSKREKWSNRKEQASKQCTWSVADLTAGISLPTLVALESKLNNGTDKLESKLKLELQSWRANSRRKLAPYCQIRRNEDSLETPGNQSNQSRHKCMYEFEDGKLRMNGGP